MAAQMCSIDDILTHLQTLGGRIQLATDENPPSDTNATQITRETIESQRMTREAQITTRMSRFYATPLGLLAETTSDLMRRIATYLVSYDIWIHLHPNLTMDDLPVGVKEWKTEAEAELEAIVPKGKEAPVAGRDVVLDGESLLVGAGDAGVPSVAFSRFLPGGGEET